MRPDTETVLTLYTEDGVFMPRHTLSDVGNDALRAVHDGVLGAITLGVDFKIDEIAQVTPNWACAHTRSERGSW